ncbi:6205_t:CDS:10 [Funneliformis geosporum]|uniref:Alkaline phosphatase n=1 Tax=Funneliformis geosporum TaxID=1117311 RepID=A0A9W4WLH3_9GLOM|nr:6205_t:CDS:10 [Funneliformis geosporum]
MSDPAEAERLLGDGQERRKVKRDICAICFMAALIVGAVIGLAAVWASLENVETPKRSVILMISDGFGPTSETFARTYNQHVNKLKYNYVSPLDEILVGSSRTRSSSSLVTDSAAGATAFACAVKSYNAAIGVTSKKIPCGTVLESAKYLGLATGLVVTSRITHATPASFSAHVIHRDMEADIATQQIGDNPLGNQVDLMFGGGRCYFLPNRTEGSCRIDQRDLHMSYEIDRDPTQEPSLKEMSEKALKFLDSATAKNDKGFFLMIEGSRIDMAAHSNDPATHVHDILAYHETVELIKNYVDEHPDTVMISVSDHETGGLSLARQVSLEYPEYLWFPEMLTRVKNSSFILSQELVQYWNEDREEFIKNSIINYGLGIDDVLDYEINYLQKNHSQVEYEFYLANMTSIRAQLGWTTHGHTAVDVNLYAYGKDIEFLRGNHENIEIGDFIVEYLNLDLDTISSKLKNSTFHQPTDSTHYHADKHHPHTHV